MAAVSLMSENTCCLACGVESISGLCEDCQKILNYTPKGKKAKILDYDERQLMERMQKELRDDNCDKKEAQSVIDYLVGIGRERFKERQVRSIQAISKKTYSCEECGRPINHVGKCLRCNRLSVSSC